MHATESKEKYQGVFIAAPTPMKQDYSIDLDRLGELIVYFRENGLRNGNAACTILGAGGEAMHLTAEERKQVAAKAVEAAEGEIPIFIGVGHTQTHQAVVLSEHADRVGAAGLQVEPPYYFQNTADDAFAFIRAISESVTCGLAIYNTPWTSGYDMDAGFVERLCELQNVIGLKWHADNPNVWARVIRQFSDRLSIVSNYGALHAPTAFMLGARGYVSQDVNAVPRAHVRIVSHLQNDRLAPAEWRVC
jgi:4-hydroxy-tetrahydrodipicolinate synthase